MLSLKDAQRLRRLLWMSEEELLQYISSEADNVDYKEFKRNYGFTIKEAQESLYELKKLINK